MALLSKILPPIGDEVTVEMKAPRAAVWDLVSDVTRIGEFSPETFEAKWTRGSTGPEKGATFAGHVKRNGVGPTYWAPCKVTDCKEGEVFEFAVIGKGPMNNWGYRLSGGEGSNPTTKVTEFYRLEATLPMRTYWTAFGWTRSRTNRKGMKTTLERMKAVVEREAGNA